MADSGGRLSQIREATKTHFGRSSTVQRFQNAARSDAHGVVMVEQDGTFLVANWRVKHDGEIGFSEEAVGSELEAAEIYRDRVRYLASAARGDFVEIVPDENAQLQEVDAEEALAGLVDFAGMRWRITLIDAHGDEIASVAGPMIPPEAFEQEGVRVARFGSSREGMEGTLRFPIDPDSRCTVEPDGAVSGKLPNGTSWIARPMHAGSSRA